MTLQIIFLCVGGGGGIFILAKCTFGDVLAPYSQTLRYLLRTPSCQSKKDLAPMTIFNILANVFFGYV
jgi:hypothetical protein